MTPKTKNPMLPLIAGGLGIGLLSFVAGRSFAPTNPPANIGTNEAPGNAAQTGTSESEEGHADEHSHAESEEGHADEHGDEHEHGEGEAIVFEGNSAQEAGIVAEPVMASPLVSTLPVSGSIEPSPNRVVRVASVVPGRIAALPAQIGARVSKGQLLAIVESRSVGEAQAAFSQASARLQNANSNLRVVEAQARAGVFSRAPLEAARNRLIETRAEVATQENGVRTNRVALENAQRLARAGSFASPSLEAARREKAEAEKSLATARAGLSSAATSVQAASAELVRRRQIAASGGYNSRPVQEAQRLLTAAQSAQNAAQSEVATTRANLARARSLNAEGLVSGRDLEIAQNAFDTATARLETARADMEAARSELERQQKLAASGAATSAEISEAARVLSAAQSEVRTRRAEVERAQEGARLASQALERETAIFRAGVANRREIVNAQSALSQSQTALSRARASLGVAQSQFAREERIFRQNLNNRTQLQAARSQRVAAQSELQAARTALQLLKSAPGGSASIPIRAPISGIVTERPVASGETLEADAPLLTLADNSIVHADFFVPEGDLGKIRVGAPLEMSANALPEHVYRGQIELIHSELDPKTRTVETHAEIANPGGLLRFGMAIRGAVQTGVQSRFGLQVPADAVQDMEGKQVVFVPGEKVGTFEARPVQTGATSGGRTVIKSGLKNGERVVVKGAFMVKAQAMKGELGHDDD